MQPVPFWTVFTWQALEIVFSLLILYTNGVSLAIGAHIMKS